jgi:hypothetical protein
MENIVIAARSFNGYFVSYPYGGHLDFVATSYQALIDGLQRYKYPYKPVIYQIYAFGKPKFVKLKSVQLKNIFAESKIK